MAFNIVVAGPGAVGQVLGGMLALAGHDVTFLGRGGSLRIDDINNEGVRVNNLRDPSRSFNVRAKAVASLDGAHPADLILLTTKTYSTDDVLPNLQPVVADSTILMSLQNGVESATKMQRFFRKGIVLGACCFMGAAVLPTGEVELNSPERVVVGDLNGDNIHALDLVLKAFEGADISATRSDDIRRDLWIKLLWNAGIFQWCAIQDKTIGELLSDDRDEQKVRETMTEVLKIAKTNRVNLSEEDIGTQIDAARAKYASVTPSLLQDLRAGQPLEHQSFAGFISKQGRFYEIPTPLNDRLLTELHFRSRLAEPIASTQWSGKIVSGTHRGTRSQQQDAVLVRQAGDVTIAVLSDGHGAIGDDVSRMAVQNFVAFLEVSQEADARAALTAAVQETDQKILDWLDKELPSYSGHRFLDSGATLLALFRRMDNIWIAHVGDSRAYHISRRQLAARQLTQDHRWVDGNIGVEQLAMSRSLGHHWDKRSENLEATPDIVEIDDFEIGDVVVLSSDGLNVSPEEMARIVLENDPHDAQKKLIEVSLKNYENETTEVDLDQRNKKSIDNTTVIVLAF